MRRWIIVLSITAVALVVWTAVIGLGVLEGWWLRPIAPQGDARALAAAVASEIDHAHKGNAAFVLIQNRRVVAEHFSSVGKPVNGATLFQVASLSKWITAWGVMTLVQSGKIALDAPVSIYLKRWHLPPSKFDNDAVTVRRLLSHTAGLTDGLGFAGFAPGQKIQTIEQSLAATGDPMPGVDGHVRVGYAPGTDWKYSGGGFAILQLLVEEVSGEPFNTYMTHAVLRPLGMSRSTFVLPADATNVAESYDASGKLAPRYVYTVVAAASLYTDTDDMTRFLLAQTSGADGAPMGRGVLQPQTVQAMRVPTAFKYGSPIWGLGTILYAPNGRGGFVVGHDGDNRPAMNTTARIDPARGDGIIVLATGNPWLASNIGGEWVFWLTGHTDLRYVVTEATRIFPVLAGGWIVILVTAIALGIRFRRRT